LVPVAYQSDRALEELWAFVTVVDARGFSAAARATGGRKATFSRRVQDLEGRLGVPLLVRTTRSLRLTDEGRAYAEHARRSLAAARDAEAVVARAKAKPSGLLRLSAPTPLAAGIVERVVAAYLARYDEVAVHLDASNRKVDLAAEGFDLAVRAGGLDDSSLVARKLGVARGGYYASPRYLERRGAPEHPRDLARHDAVFCPKADGAIDWPFVVDGKRKAIALRPRLTVTSVELAVRAAAAGVGVVRAPLDAVAPLLAKGRLVEVLAPFAEPGLNLYAVYPPGGALVPKTRAFLDLLAAWFKKNRGVRAGAAAEPG
jgi:LysR family transcriptional regulator, regulator for bpeEF and oprC